MWGSNYWGQLGDGSKEDNPTPKLVQGELANKKVVQVACGYRHTLTLTDQGEVFFWGHRIHGDIACLPQRVKGDIDNRKAVAVACTEITSHVLLEDGQLYGWGWNFHGQLGIGDKRFQSDPVRVEDLIGKRIKQVACGKGHCLALTDSGQIFAWGYDGDWPTRTDQRRPVQVASQFGKAVQIAAFRTRSAVEFADGTVRACDKVAIDYDKYDIEEINWYEESFPNYMTESSWTEHSSIDEAFAPYPMRRTLIFDRKVPADSKLDDKETADFCFQVDDRQIWAHKPVLAQGLPYFDVMFQSRWDGTNKTDSPIHHSYGAFKAFLNYIYTKQFGDSEEERSDIFWQELHELADFYGHLDISKRCKAYLSHGELDVFDGDGRLLNEDDNPSNK